jgi:hypothetical protein
MNLLLFTLVPLAVLIGLVWGTIRFRPLFYFYLFAFIPIYLLLFRELYARLYVESAGFNDIPDRIKLIKDFAWVAVLVCFLLRSWLGRRKIRFLREIGLSLLLFCGYLFLEAVRGAQTIGFWGAALAVRQNLLYVPAALMAFNLIRTAEDLRAITRAYAYVMLAAAGYGFVQMFLNLPTVYFLLRPDMIFMEHYYSSFFSDYNALGWFSGTALGLLLPQRAAFGRSPWLYYLAVLVSFFWMIACQSRTAVIALVVVVGAWLILQRRQGIRPLTVIVLVSVIALSGLVYLAPNMLYSHRLQGELLSDIRIVQAWPSLWSRFWEHPIAGHGLGLFGSETMNKLVPDQPDEFAGVDNTYFTIALTGGVIGLGLFAFLLGKILKLSLRLQRDPARAPFRNAVTGLQLALLVSLIYFIPSNFLESFPESVHFWFLVGALTAIPGLRQGACSGQASVPTSALCPVTVPSGL